MKRGRYEIKRDILEICKTGAGITRIVYQANLNFHTAELYLTELEKDKLIENKSMTNKRVWHTTIDGIEILKKLKALNW